jgi:hypothetical protein
MLFNIEVDEGTRIVGYLVPDAFSGSPSLRITDGHKDLLTLRCSEERAALVAAGRHQDGRCGFTIDDSIVANLAQQTALEIYDEATNLLIYRRRPPSQVTQRRILRLETHLLPLWRLDNAVEKKFQFFHKGIERPGRETTTQLFLLNNSSSLYLSGRLIFKAYDNYINESFNCVALLRDPYEEMAERLLTLKHARDFGRELLGERDFIALGPAIAFAETIENDKKVLHRAFANMPKAVIANLANPLTRQLAARSPDEIPTKGAVATALSTLSSFTVLGLRECQDVFLVQLADLVGLPPDALPMVSNFTETAELSGLLKEVPEAALLIEQDLEVYHHVESAIRRALTDDLNDA